MIAALALAGAAFRRASASLLMAAFVLEAVAAVGVWVAFALRHDRSLAVAAGGLTACALVAGAAILLRRALKRVEATDARLAEAQADLVATVEREKQTLAKEVELTLARARADSRSLLEQQERQIAEERRTLVAEREHDATAALGDKLNQVQAQTSSDSRVVTGPRSDRRRDEAADRRARAAAAAVAARDRAAAHRRRRAAVGRERGAARGRRAAARRAQPHARRRPQPRAQRARDACGRPAQGAPRARERMAGRERALTEQAQREEADAIQRVRSGFEDLSRRQIEQLERAVDRAVASHADEAAQRFAQLVKTSREDAAKRLARELDRAVSTFSREAETVLAERLAHVGDAGAQRLETPRLERLEGARAAPGRARRLPRPAAGELESEIRRKIDDLRSDIDAERGVLEARLEELMRRVGSAAAVRGS